MRKFFLSIFLLLPLFLFSQPLVKVEWIWPDSLKYRQVNIKDLEVKNGVIFAATSGLDIMVSSDTGRTWQVKNNGLIASARLVLTIAKASNGDLYCGTLEGLFRSEDNGNNWQNLLSDSFTGGTGAILINHAGTIFVANGDNIVKSEDNGNSWQIVFLRDSLLSVPSSLIETTLGTLLCGNLAAYLKDCAGILRSTNGITWERILVVNPLQSWPNSVWSLGAAPYGSTFRRIFVNSYLGGCFYSDDDGLSWHRIIGIPYRSNTVGGRGVFVDPEGLGIFLGFSGNGPNYSNLFRSTDGGTTWSPIDTFKSFFVLSFFKMDERRLLVGTHNGVFLLTFDSATSVKEQNIPIPQIFSLYQNYPNPFNSSTTIEFDLPKRSYVRLVVFDVLGSEIKRLIDEEKNEGRHQVVFEAGDLKSGIYFYVLDAGDFRKVKKMVLLK